MDALGGRDLWGVRSTIPGRTHVDPGLIVERLFESVPQILNELMDKTPVERLSDVDLKVEDLGPPAGDNPFQEWKRRSIRWQLGL
jgi:hypothetical protein